jgi:hypothetical protein
MTGKLEDLVLDGDYKGWGFGIDVELAPAMVEKIREEKTRAIEHLKYAALAIRRKEPCNVCFGDRAMLICGNCERMVWCEKCGSVACPKCGCERETNPNPSGSNVRDACGLS